MIKNMNRKMTKTHIYQQLNLKEKKQKQTRTGTKQTTRTGTESQKWRSHGELSAGRGRGEKGGKWGKQYLSLIHISEPTRQAS